MKKINNIQQLKAAKKKLLRRREELEKIIHYDWLDVKQSLQPHNMGRSFLNSMAGEPVNKTGAGFIAENLSALAAGITQKSILKAAEKIRNWFKKN